MAGPRRFDLDDLLIRPGTYFNPETEVLLVVDDSPQARFRPREASDSGGDWLLVSDDTPLDEHGRDELLEAFVARFAPGTSGAVAGDEDDLGEEEVELEPDPEELH
jgi:hypothetical protein